MKNEEYYKTIRSLNAEQKSLYDHCMLAATRPEPMRIFISGGAGVGKSVLMRTLQEKFTRYYDHFQNIFRDRLKVLKMAPTGSAAHNIEGSTIHFLHKIPINKLETGPLNTEKLNAMRSKFADVRVILLDEVSMISYDLFKMVYAILRIILRRQPSLRKLTCHCFRRFVPLSTRQRKILVRQFSRRLANHICRKLLDTIRNDGIDRNNELKRGPHLCGIIKQA